MEPHRSPETQLLQSTTTCIVQIDNKVCQFYTRRFYKFSRYQPCNHSST